MSKKAEDFELDEFPYKDPKYEPVLFSILIGTNILQRLLIFLNQLQNDCLFYELYFSSNRN